MPGRHRIPSLCPARPSGPQLCRPRTPPLARPRAAGVGHPTSPSASPNEGAPPAVTGSAKGSVTFTVSPASKRPSASSTIDPRHPGRIAERQHRRHPVRRARDSAAVELQASGRHPDRPERPVRDQGKPRRAFASPQPGRNHRALRTPRARLGQGIRRADRRQHRRRYPVGASIPATTRHGLRGGPGLPAPVNRDLRHNRHRRLGTWTHRPHGRAGAPSAIIHPVEFFALEHGCFALPFQRHETDDRTESHSRGRRRSPLVGRHHQIRHPA